MNRHPNVLLLLVLLCSSPLSAQQLATLTATVLDTSGSAVSGAHVNLRNMETNAKRIGITNDEGEATIPGLVPGNYELTVTANQFRAYTIPLILAVAQVASAKVTLGIDTQSEIVHVQDTLGDFDILKSEISQVIDKQKIADLPISGRDFIDFVLLAPTANVGRSTAVGAQAPFQEDVLELSFAGLRETHSIFFGLDDTDYTTSISGVQRASPSQDWVQEFRVTESPYTADNGRNLGAVVNTITKSGSNDFHGSIYEFFRNNSLDSKSLISAPGFNALRFNQFGTNLGGPARREKEFFFLGYEGQRKAESPLYSTFILHCLNYQGCLGPGSPSINQVKQLLGLQPEELNSILPTDNYQKIFGKVTSVFSDKMILNTSYLFNNDVKNRMASAAPGQGLPSSYRDNKVHDQTVYANLLNVFGSNWTSETELDFARRLFDITPIGAGYEPGIIVADTLNSGGFQGSVSHYEEQHFEGSENVTYIHKKHSFKYGGDFEPVWIDAHTTFLTPGDGIFTAQSFFGTGPFASPAFGPATPVQFLFLEPRSLFGQQIPSRTLPYDSLYSGAAAQQFTQATNLNFLHKLIGLYGQDQWAPSANLSLTFGLRYDIDFLPSAADVHVNGAMNPTNYGNLQPRIGVAYSFRQGKSVVRTGFGMFSGPFDYSDVMVSWQGASAFTNMNQPLLPEFSNPDNSLVGFGLSGIVGVSGPMLASKAFSNFTHNGTYPDPATLQQFPLGYVKRDFSSTYAEQAGLELENEITSGVYVSAGYQFTHALHLPMYSSINGIPNGTLPDGMQSFTPADPNFGFTLEATPNGFSIYHAGTLSIRKPFSRHFSFLANYSIAKSIDIVTDVQLTAAPMDYLNPHLDRALGDNDVRHRFVVAALAETPAEWSTWSRNIKFSILNTMQSPHYYTIYAGFDVNGDEYPFSDRVGDIGRNTYRGDAFYTTDVRLQKLFAVREHIEAEVSAEIFNLFNRQNVTGIDTVYGAASFVAQVPTKFGDRILSPANASFGTPNYVAPARQMQLSVRLNF